MSTTTLAAKKKKSAPPQANNTAKKNNTRRSVTGWLFMAPFTLVFLTFLVAPLGYAAYLSLFQKSIIGGTKFVLFENYSKAFSDPEFIDGVGFVIRFSLVLIPLQMFISLVLALVLDQLTTRFAKTARLMIFLPYAIPAVIGAIMWGFLYSKNFGPLGEIFALLNSSAPDLLSKQLVFFGLMNIVTWQWAGYYMIILYAALQGIDTTLYEAAKIDGASNLQIILNIKIPLVTPALVLILVFALIGTLQFFNEPQILRPLAAGAIDASFTPNMYAYQQAFLLANFNYGSTISFALGAVVFICVYIFIFFTRRKGGFML
jgi:multiple sugar transport system permease protein